MATYTAKETLYQGVLFRSKNEAKWAMFFDEVGIDWEYEPQLFTGWNNERYKPDFYFPQYDKYAEVKSNTEGIMNDAMAKKLNGAIDYQTTSVSKGLLLLGAFPYDVRVFNANMHLRWLFWHKGVCSANAYITPSPMGGGKISFTFDDIDSGDPIPKKSSPDVIIKTDYRLHGSDIYDAILKVNNHFAQEEYR